MGWFTKKNTYASYVVEGVAQKHTCVYQGRQLLLGFVHTAQKMKFSIKNIFSFTREILTGKFNFLYSDILHGRFIMVALIHFVPIFPFNTL